jgi:hypothetical protein
MNSPIFGRLEPVSVRNAWAHEAADFTPWLALNLDRLSEALGIPLELERTEVAVGRYSADIFARNPRDGSTVLIENQLEYSDHTHLGQIMTYLTGLEAQTIVWIAPEFREEHRSAIRWLNEHTVDPFAFFAVRVRVVRIGDSAMAPLFEVLEQPNGWDRKLQDTIREAREASPVVATRRAFWARYVERHPEAADDVKAGGGAAIWRAVPGSRLVVSQYKSAGQVGIFVRGVRGDPDEAAVTMLADQLASLEVQLGVQAGQGRFAFLKTYPLDTDDPETLRAAGDWLASETNRYVAILTEALEATDSG